MSCREEKPCASQKIFGTKPFAPPNPSSSTSTSQKKILPTYVPHTTQPQPKPPLVRVYYKWGLLERGEGGGAGGMAIKSSAGVVICIYSSKELLVLNHFMHTIWSVVAGLTILSFLSSPVYLIYIYILKYSIKSLSLFIIEHNHT